MTITYSPEERQKWLGSLHRTPASATVLLENNKGELLIVRSNYRTYWTTPGGVIDAGESPKEAALREVAEEVCIHLPPEEVQFVGVVYRTSELLATYQFLFAAKLTDEMASSIVLQASEIEEHALVSKTEVQQEDRQYAARIKKWAANDVLDYDEEMIQFSSE